MERVLVVFEATTAKTESLALAFGLGAVEGGANIRLRHLDSAVPCELEHQGYGPPKDADIEWAQGIGLALESAEPAPEVEAFLEQLERVRSSGGVAVCVFGGAAGMASVTQAREKLERLGIAVAGTEPDEADGSAAKAAGRHMAGS